MDVVVAAHPEDLVAEFLSVLDRDLTQPLQVVTATSNAAATIPAGSVGRRHDALRRLVAGTAHSTGPIHPARLAALLNDLPTAEATVWTHCPADERADRARVGWLTAQECSPESVLHSVGASLKYQFRCEVNQPLSTEQIHLKLNVPGIAKLPTEAVAACERFTRLTAEEASGLYALRHSLDVDASVVSDPWDFAHSPYEADRLRNTSTWISRHIPPGSGTLVEIGSCEGALTTQLLDTGHDVVANEPDERFRSRLETALNGRANITTAPLEALVLDAPAAAYLLIEMIYYLDDLSVLDGLPADLMLIGVAPDYFSRRVEPWLTASQVWELVEHVELTPARVEFVCGDRVYQRKAGSTGVLCRRTTPTRPDRRPSAARSHPW